MGVSTKILITGLLLATPGWAIEDGAANEERAKQALASKLMKISQLDSMIEAKYPESVGAKGFDRDSGNSTYANTTYHKYVWSYCLDWVGDQYCQKWLDPYVSKHGFNAGDRSPLEGLVAAEWNKHQGADNGNTYAIWNIERDGGGGGNNQKNTDVDGKLVREGITSWKLLPDIERKVQNLGRNYAEIQIGLTYDEDAPKNEMPNPVALRMMASRYTKVFRNNLLANIGELRAKDRLTEFALGEDKASCASYIQAVQAQQDQVPTEERIYPQPKLQPETRGMTLQQRLQYCLALRRAPYNMIDPQPGQGGVQAGTLEEERYDEMADRVNLALVDQVGLNPNDIPHPGTVAFQKQQYSNVLIDHNYGGTVRGAARLTNAEQLASYNQVLEWAAAGMEGAAARAGGAITSNAGQVRSYKIAPGTRNMIELNSLTPEMRGELANTSFVRSGVMSGPAERTPERSPSELTIQAAR